MGGKTSTTTQQVQIPKEVMDRYNSVNKRAEGLADTPFKQYSSNPADFVAQLNDQQKTGFNTVNNAANSYQGYMGQAADAVGAGMGSAQPQALNLSQFYNPYQQQVIDATMKQMGQANEQAQSGALGTAVSSGAFGGDRAGIAAANLANQQGLAMGSTLAGLNAQNYNQALAAAQQQQGVQLGASQADLARLMQGGQLYAGLGSQALQSGLASGEAQINAGTLGQQTEQAGKSALYNQFQQEQAYPFQIAQFLANIAMGTGALSGSNTITTQPSSFWSDRRLKRDIKRVGTADNGLPVYTFKYKGDDTEQTHVGYMADEVEKKHPDAVGVAGNGYKFVDYDRASRATGGGVAGPYGIQAGSQDPYAAGYVPQAYLPVGQLMVADPALLQNSEQSMAQQLDAMNRFGDTVSGLKDKYDAARKWWNGNDPDTEPQKEHDRLPNWRGGLVGYADGGAAYLGARGGLNPVDTRTYLSDTLDDQKKRDDELMRPNGTPNAPKSGFENVLDAGKMAMALFGFERGGVVGRHGYALDGAVDDEERRHRMAAASAPKDVSADLGSAIRAIGRDAEGYGQGKVDPALFRAAGLGTAAQPSVTLSNPATPQLPDGGVVPAVPAPPTDPLATSPRPQPRPAGLVPAPRPDADVINMAGAAINNASAPAQGQAPALSQPEIGPRDFYRTNILKQESGHRQFDENGRPLTSSAGAIGIGQILPSTGPEAAKLAGLPWDENHFYNDADYNAALGEAYFMRQYQTFGSLDKAAAAYNAGPGALSSAIDRATAVGGSYLDYLPAETQKYVLATTGQGGSGGLAGGRDRLSLASQSAPVDGGSGDGKLYGERNRLGQMFYDRDGRVNKDALLSILSGIGTMASSPSRYLGASILQGIGGAANTYMAREQQRADISAKNLENMRQVAMDTMQWNELNGTNFTPAQYARAMNIDLAFPEAATAQDILSGTYKPTTGGQGLDKLSYREFQNGAVSIGGREVPMQNDPASLQRFIQDNGIFGPDTPIGRQVEQAKAQLAAINASGGMTTDKNGQQFQLPGYISVGDTQAQADQNRVSTAAFRETANARLPEISKGLANIGKQAAVFTQLEAGALTNELSNFGAVAAALGLPVPEGVEANRAYAEQALKIAADGAIQQLNGLPGTDKELGVLQSISASPNLQPEAVKTVLSMQKAALLQEQDRYRLRSEWNAANPGREMDQTAYEQWFSETHPYSEYYENAKKSMPIFKGEAVDPAAAEAELIRRGYVKKPDGTWGKPTNGAN
jgi:hypothetical protein